MGKPRGFLEDARTEAKALAPKERVKNYQEFYVPLSKKDQQIQAGRCMNCGVAFCHTGIIAPSQKITQPYGVIGCTQTSNQRIVGGEVGCPLHNLIPEWNDLIYKGHWEQAYDRLNLTNPFPEFTGRVCPAPCEDSCVCAINGESVTIKANELAIIENAYKNKLVTPYKPMNRSNKKIAIIGSGPAGLACAWELNQYGYQVVVFERSDRIGGLLMYGIPDMKLDKSVIERRVKMMCESGIVFKTNHPIDSQKKVDSLLSEYDALVLATGASKPIDLCLEGRNLEGIMFAVDYLTHSTKSLLDSKQGDYLAKGKDVLIIGSGDTSVDCVAVATRQGAKSITRFERSPKRPLSRPKSNPWPLKKQTFSTDYGLKEAIEVYGKDPREYQKLTQKFVGKNGKVSGVIASDLCWSEDSQGRRISQAVKDSQKEYKADLVLLAMGFGGSEEQIQTHFNVAFDAKNNICTHNYETTHHRIYACGDAKMGQSLVVWAIQDGIKCAQAIQQMLGKSDENQKNNNKCV
ncbi:glutamate synthase subunit beta [Helicobacter sp. MIT 05-5293]|uniref:glutamate synthase subunit beta n=1 Tax=Helicobacter sp. MIT 05-5293 TaxID=1548149 RepID=UPI00051DDEC4|nr:glutamate synthase subunit beta [Helicobacter sp. MIT 05-5293]TLD81672.1 glutamate synthase subunit beta [Helicobacter sp. MIT 05-5293]